MKISVEKAVNLIDATLRLNKNERVLPYFFIVGAGISCPEIPLAGGIIELCKNEIKNRNSEYFMRYEEDMQKYESDPVKNYSGWIELAYPNSIDRSRFFKEIIKKAKISSANMQLAHILYSKKIASTVFTTNFDDKLKQALELIGVSDLFVAENAMDNLVINPQNTDVQVVHVHGTYNFYDCANLEHEIRAVATQTNTLSSSRLLASFLNNQAPIIVGYSGWENDVIMTCLKERLMYPTPLKYIWVCYSQNAYNSLPDWLKNSNSVDFVIPEINDLSCDDDVDDSRYVLRGDAQHRTNLDAVTFFSLLISATKLDIPEIFKNPFSYYSKRIDMMLPEHEDVLHLRHWAERMKFFGTSNSDFENLVEQMEHADITNDFSKATESVYQISGLNLPVGDVLFTYESLFRGLLNKESVFISIDNKINFRFAVISFIEKNYEVLKNKGIINECLMDLLMWRWKRDDREPYIQLLKRINTIASRDVDTFETQIVTLGQMSTIVQSEDEQKQLLEKLIELTVTKLDNPAIIYYRCVALYQLAEIENEERALELIAEADKLIKKDKSVRLYTLAMKTKSELLHSLSDSETKKKWIKDIIRAITKNYEKLDIYKVLNIAANISILPQSTLKEIEKVQDFLEEVYSKCKDLDLSFCENAYGMAAISVAIHELKDDIKDIQFYDDVKCYSESIPRDCRKAKSLQKHALALYCSKPIAVVPDQLKIDEIKRYKKIFPDEKENVIDVIMLACEKGNVDLYNRCFEIKEEMAYYENYQKHTKAFDQYVARDFDTAERLFTEVINCGLPELETSSRNNLAFMVRRGETTETRESFWDLITIVPNTYIFKHMNIALYCLKEGYTDDARYLSAIESLKNMSEEEKSELIGCWGDPDFVGQDEHKVAMNLINGTMEEIK